MEHHPSLNAFTTGAESFAVGGLGYRRCQSPTSLIYGVQPIGFPLSPLQAIYPTVNRNPVAGRLNSSECHTTVATHRADRQGTAVPSLVNIPWVCFSVSQLTTGQQWGLR